MPAPKYCSPQQTAVVAILLGLYVGAYSALVDRWEVTGGAIYTRPIDWKTDSWLLLEVQLERIFAPVHWIDRRLRTKRWSGPLREPAIKQDPI